MPKKPAEAKVEFLNPECKINTSGKEETHNMPTPVDEYEFFSQYKRQNPQAGYEELVDAYEKFLACESDLDYSVSEEEKSSSSASLTQEI